MPPILHSPCAGQEHSVSIGKLREPGLTLDDSEALSRRSVAVRNKVAGEREEVTGNLVLDEEPRQQLHEPKRELSPKWQKPCRVDSYSCPLHTPETLLGVASRGRTSTGLELPHSSIAV